MLLLGKGRWTCRHAQGRGAGVWLPHRLIQSIKGMALTAPTWIADLLSFCRNNLTEREVLSNSLRVGVAIPEFAKL